MTLEHLGIAVADGDAATALFARLLGLAPYKTETVAQDAVRTVFFGDGAPHAAPKLELVEALGPASPIARFLEQRGPGLHHVAFEVEDVAAELARLAAEGVALIDTAPRPGADGKLVAFLHPRSTAGVLVELCQTAPPARLAVPFRGGALAAQVSGPADGPPLLVLHGALGSTDAMTRPLARAWARRLRVVALDLPGHGASDAFPGLEPTIAPNTEAAVATLDAAGIARAHVFGFSMGAAVALHLAHAHPARVDRLALLGTNVQWDAAEVAAMTGAMRSALTDPADRWAPLLAEAHGADRWRALTEQLIAFTERLPEHRFPDDALAAIASPALVAHGDRDRYFALRHAVHLAATLPQAQLAVLPGTDHPIQGVDAALFAPMVERFLLG